VIVGCGARQLSCIIFVLCLERRPILLQPLTKVFSIAIALAYLTLGLTACQPAISADSPLQERVLLVGSGASFPALIYQSWFIALNRDIPALRVNYQSLGSGAGVEQFISETIDFGASDVAMTDAEMAQVSRGVLLLPMTAGSIVLVYNLPDVESGLNLPREVYSDILLGAITRWDDPRIAAANPDVTLPGLPITVVHRADGSGTTEVLTKHLSTVRKAWKTAVGVGKSVDWPDTGIFVGAKGNEGVTAQVMQNQGSLGYVEYSYAVNNGLAMAALENKAGNFVLPSDESAAATLASVTLPDNLRAFIVDPPGDASYPLVTYTWLLAYRHYDDPLKARALEIALEFCLNKGQTVASTLGYVQLPDTVRQQVAEVADQISPDYTITVIPGDKLT
jgi:phosphate transport system substrate-binding protein